MPDKDHEDDERDDSTPDEEEVSPFGTPKTEIVEGDDKSAVRITMTGSDESEMLPS